MMFRTFTIIISLTVASCSTENLTSDLLESADGHRASKMSGVKVNDCNSLEQEQYGLRASTASDCEKNSVKQDQSCVIDLNEYAQEEYESEGLTCVEHLWEKKLSFCNNSECQLNQVFELTKICEEEGASLSEKNKCSQHALAFIEKKNQTKKNTTIEIKQYPAPLPK